MRKYFLRSQVSFLFDDNSLDGLHDHFRITSGDTQHTIYLLGLADLGSGVSFHDHSGETDGD